ncbi:lysylphosphatidylglycerol synthase domain-containing protein [Bacillus aquiflavi]|uniref:lysylphosphatidylglycerol synthase domain-containing protein n=1 Tax=Bacillus aquiflavi TaxID=2672567 RepID=UPI00223AEE33|nr:lysylphosphatidylglycerol synthase domain-containing protein [Bacillus aquiflavi]
MIVFELDEIFKDFNWKVLEQHIDRLSFINIVTVLLMSLVALFPMHFYDVILVRLFKINIPNKKLLLYSLSANAYSNFVGFGGVAGATLRTYYYKKYLHDDIPYIQIIAKLSLFFLTGLSLLCSVILFFFSHSLLFLELKWMKIAVWSIALYTPFLFIILFLKKDFWNIRKTRRTFFLELMIISFFEWLFVTGCVWGITLILHVPITLEQLFPIVVISSCAGIISLIPGGIGSFDLLFLTGFELYGIDTELSLLVILLYRLSYYVFPVLLGTPVVFIKLFKKG